MTAPLIFTREVIAKLQLLRDLAAQRPVDVAYWGPRLKIPEQKEILQRQMNEQSLTIPGPAPFLVTFSFETGYPQGIVLRRMTMSVTDGVPTPEAAWIVAIELGFKGGITACTISLDDIEAGGKAVNLSQPTSTAAVSTRTH